MLLHNCIGNSSSFFRIVDGNCILTNEFIGLERYVPLVLAGHLLHVGNIELLLGVFQAEHIGILEFPAIAISGESQPKQPSKLAQHRIRRYFSIEIFAVPFRREHGPQYVDHDCIHNWKTIQDVFDIGVVLLVEQIQELREQLLELAVVVDLSGGLWVDREQDLELGMQHVVSQVVQECLIHARLRLQVVAQPE